MAPAAATFVASVTSAKASIPASLSISACEVNLFVVVVSSISSASRTTAPVCVLTESTVFTCAPASIPANLEVFAAVSLSIVSKFTV